MEAHPAVQKLAKCVDLDHSCGFISMLKPSASNISNARRRTISANFGLLSPSHNDPRSLSPLIMVSDVDSSQDSDEPNEEEGTDPMSCCSSVDDMVMISKNHKQESAQSPDQWVPLDLCYGLPLFDGDLSKQVYQKVRNR